VVLVPSNNPKMFVILASDTEDNHPNYVPGWWRYGSDYDADPPKLRFDWLRYMDNLLSCLDQGGLRFKVTWFLRTDPAVGERCLDALTLLMDKVRDYDDELGIHIHTLRRDAQSRWVQSLDQNVCRSVVSDSLEIFKSHMGKLPNSARMGWNYMSNSVMQQLEDDGVRYDATCIPGMQSQLMYGQRDNFYDWSRAPTSPFHPSYEDYQAAGKMKILEIPLTSYVKEPGTKSGNVFPKWMRAVARVRRLTNVGATMTEFPFLASKRSLMLRNQFLIFSAWRNNTGMSNLLASKVQEARSRGWAYILGYFHPCEMMNPLSGKLNSAFLENFAASLNEIATIRKHGVDLVPVTISEFGSACLELKWISEA